MNFEWTKDLEIGDKEIDSQHYKLFQQFNLLWSAEYYGIPKKIFQVLNLLDDYIMIHFNYEENQMLIHHYPGYAVHREKHREFIRQYQDLKDKLVKDGPNNAVYTQTLDFLNIWINEHIKQLDQDFAVYFKNNTHLSKYYEAG